MKSILRSGRIACAILAIASSTLAFSAVAPGSHSARPQVTQKIDDSKLVTLAGNTRPEARNAAFDKGPAPLAQKMPPMQLLLRRTPEQEAALAKLMDQLHTPGNANYHQWLTAAEFAESFGVSQSDVNAAKGWLTAHGFTITGGTGTGLQIEFQGTIGQVNEAFHTEIHNIQGRDGNTHLANVRDPQIPAELAKVVVGPTSLNTFPAHNYITKRAPVQIDPQTHEVVKVGTPTPETAGSAKPEYTFSNSNGTYYAMVPGDIQTIYNLTPLYSAGYTGAGATIGFLEDTPIYTTADFTTYQSTFGLTSYGGSYMNNNPAKPSSGGVTCSAAIDNGDDIEAELDVEMGIAVAPGAKIVNENCADTSVFGGLLAYENLENSTTFPAVISMSYGECEAANGSASNASFNTAFQQGAAEGISTFVSAGDNDTQSCDQAEETEANQDTYGAWGLGVTGWGETPYNVAVGGTDFGDTYAGTNSTYWSATNSTYYASALSYIPEIPWNDSCASALIYGIEGYSSGAGTSGFCAATTPYSSGGLVDDIGGGGGYSTCATGAATTTAVVSGSCAGYAQPSWQTGLLGVPTSTPAYGTIAAKSTAVRTVPDVSLFAANGVWGHFITICYSNTEGGGAACTGAPSGWVGIGGTSASAPMMASIQALVNQYVGGATSGNGAYQGNPNYVYYKLAKTEYGSSGSSTCNSTLGNAVGSSCVFYDVTQGDDDPTCAGSYNCYLPSGTYGIASTVTGSDDPAYNTTTGYDTATGIGTVNAYNLAINWRNAFPSTTALAASPTSITTAQSTTLTATVTGSTPSGYTGKAPTPSGSVNFFSGSSEVGSCTLSSGTCTLTVSGSTLGAGTHSMTATFSGSNAYPASTSTAVTVTVTSSSVNTTTTVTATPSSSTQGQSVALKATVTATSGTPTGTVSFKVGSSTSLGTCTLSGGTCTLNTTALPVGSDTVTASYPGVTGFNASSGTVSVTVSAATATTTTAVTATPNPAVVGQTVTVKATVTASSGTATGTVSFAVGTTAIGNCTLSGGSCTLSASTSTLTAGTYPVVATYAGTTGFGGSTSPSYNVVLNKASTTTTVTASPSSVTPPADITLTATVKRSAPGAGTATGTVTFKTGTTTIGTSTLNGSGVASFTSPTNGVSAGSYPVTATYSGDASDNASSGSVTVTVK